AGNAARQIERMRHRELTILEARPQRVKSARTSSKWVRTPVTGAGMVAKVLDTFKEFPPRAKAASFTVSDAMDKIMASLPAAPCESRALLSLFRITESCISQLLQEAILKSKPVVRQRPLKVLFPLSRMMVISLLPVSFLCASSTSNDWERNASRGDRH